MTLTGEEWAIVRLSLLVGGVATIVTLPLAFALAWVLARVRFPGKVLLDGVVYLPLVVPPVVTGWVLLIAFGPNGVIGAWLQSWFGVTVLFRWTGASIAAGVMALPLMVRAMRLSIEAVDRRLEQAARTLGAGRWRTFATITLPLSLPGVLAGAMLGFARSIGEFGATITFVSNVPGETQTLPLAIYAALQRPDGDAMVWRLSAISIALSLVALVVSELLARARGGARMSFDIDVRLLRGDASISVAFVAGAGVTVLFGPSGVGKTSTLDMIAGLVRPDRGHVRVDGKTLFDSARGIDLAVERRGSGFVFQDARLFPHRRVRANLSYGAAPGASIDAVAGALDIAHLLDRWPRTLSGGETRRVAIGRALLSNPRFLLLDEPLSSLDRARREEAIAAIARAREIAPLPTLLVTHDRAEAERLGDRIIEL